MTEEEILTKAIEKATDGGWKKEPMGLIVHPDTDVVALAPMFIFNHDFAKALWGDGKTVGQDENYESDELDDRIIFDQELWHADDGLTFTGKLWQYHLQQMAVAKDPIKYLGENI